MENKKISESRRSRMTKQVIKSALADLLQTTTLHSVTVKALCEAADINRSTFYAHYTDIFAVLQEIEQDFIRRMPVFSNQMHQTITRDGQRAMLREYINYIVDNETIFNVLWENNMLSANIYDYMLNSGMDIFAPGVDAPDLYRLLMCQSNSGTNTMLRLWLKQRKFTVDEIVEIILCTLPVPSRILKELRHIRKE